MSGLSGLGCSASLNAEVEKLIIRKRLFMAVRQTTVKSKFYLDCKARMLLTDLNGRNVLKAEAICQKK